MSIILDLIIVAIIVLMVLLSAKRGFVRVAIELVGFILAVFISFTISTPLAGTTYDKLIEPKIVSVVTETVGDVAIGSADSAANHVWEGMPDWIKNNADKFGFSKENIDKEINENLTNGVDSIVLSVSQKDLRPIVTKPLGIIYSLIFSLVLIQLVKPLAKLINKLFTFSVIGKLNRILGGTVGLLKGILFASLLCIFVSLIVSFSANGFLGITQEVIEKSWFFDILTFNIF